MGITGFASPAADYRKLPLSLDELLIENRAATFIAKASGNALNGIGIFDGDVLVIDRSIKPRIGDVLCVVIDGEFIVRILDDKYRLVTTGKEKPIKHKEGMTVEGVVTRCMTCFRPSSVFKSGE